LGSFTIAWESERLSGEGIGWEHRQQQAGKVTDGREGEEKEGVGITAGWPKRKRSTANGKA
jgi:hypothetical protein